MCQCREVSTMLRCSGSSSLGFAAELSKNYPHTPPRSAAHGGPCETSNMLEALWSCLSRLVALIFKPGVHPSLNYICLRGHNDGYSTLGHRPFLWAC